MTHIALAIRQPWAWLMFARPADLPTGVTPLDFLGPNVLHSQSFHGRLLIVASSKRFDHDAAQWLRERHKIVLPEALVRGEAVGFVEVGGLARFHASMWFRPPGGHIIQNPLPISSPIRMAPRRPESGLYLATIHRGDPTETVTGSNGTTLHGERTTTR